MNDIEHTNRQINNPSHSTSTTSKQKRRTQRQKTSPSPEAQLSTTSGHQIASLDLHQTVPTPSKSHNTTDLIFPTSAKPGAGNSNSLPGHQSGRTKNINPSLLDQQALNLSDSLSSSGTGGEHDQNNSPSSSLARKKNLSTSDLDPIERKKQVAVAKVEAKLEKAQRLHQKAQQSVEQEISDFLRVTSIPNVNNENNSSSRTTNASFEKRIKTLQDTKKELEKKIANYQSDISRIQSGDIPTNYSSSKDFLSNIKSTAAKVAGGSLKHRSTNNTNEQTNTYYTPSTTEPTSSFHFPTESDTHNLSSTLITPTTTTGTITSTSTGGANNNPNVSVQNQHNNSHEPMHSSVSHSASNEVGNSQFYIDPTHEYVYDLDKSNRKHDTNTLPVDGLGTHDNDKSPLSKRRLTDDLNVDSYDQLSNHSNDDRFNIIGTSKRHTSTTTEYQQLNSKIDTMQKVVDRYESKIYDMQKQLDSLITTNETLQEQNKLLNDELNDLIELHQIEMSSMKTDLKNLEERLVYKFNDYWNELLEKLDKLDTRTAKVEQTQTHSLETEENTHRIISKLVNILLTVFAIILLLLSTIKNLVQSRIHAVTILIIALVWITFHYLPPNYFQTSFLKNFSNMFKRAS